MLSSRTFHSAMKLGFNLVCLETFFSQTSRYSFQDLIDDNCRLFIEAFVTDSAGGHTQSLRYIDVVFTSKPLQINLQKTELYFKPGLPFVIHVSCCVPLFGPVVATVFSWFVEIFLSEHNAGYRYLYFMSCVVPTLEASCKLREGIGKRLEFKFILVY